jgi:DNA polymerase I-like protein with 3'-5' exonuclease and polymerase domains
VKNHIKISDEDAKKARTSFMALYKTIAKHIEQTKFRFEHGKPRQVQMKDSMGNTYAQTLPYQEEVCTLFGRRLSVETANTALNYGIQGSGGDTCKLAVCLFEEITKKEHIDAFVCNMIHDDIVVQASISDKERAQKALADAMNGAANCLMGHYFLTDVSDEIETFAETPVETA